LESNDMKTDLPTLPEPSEMDGARWGYTADDMQGHATDAYNAGWVAGRKALFEEMKRLADSGQGE